MVPGTPSASCRLLGGQGKLRINEPFQHYFILFGSLPLSFSGAKIFQFQSHCISRKVLPSLISSTLSNLRANLYCVITFWWENKAVTFEKHYLKGRQIHRSVTPADHYSNRSLSKDPSQPASTWLAQIHWQWKRCHEIAEGTDSACVRISLLK